MTSTARVLLLNLTRFGDLIQTQGVIHGLRNQGDAVGLVCVDAFADAARIDVGQTPCGDSGACGRRCGTLPRNGSSI
jgi:hypothetical protein